MSGHLDRIVAHHRRRVADDPRPADALLQKAHQVGGVRDFAGALSRPGLSVIAEVKRRSPSKGEIAPELDPAALARAYAEGGAACVSVLTDERFFGGSLDDLAAARGACELPVLRKDFTLSSQDVCEARLAGADAVLLIAAVLSDTELAELGALSRDLGMGCLTEAHDEQQVERALAAGATVVGVNQRDLRDFSVDQERAERLAKLIPDSVIKVAESGISGPDDAARAAAAGYDAVLVGEMLVRSEDPSRAVRELACS